MNQISSEKIALEQLETAIRLYEDSEEYISVITLAGAAEEILGKACREKGIRTALEDVQHNFYLYRKLKFGNCADEEKKKSERFISDNENYARNKAKHVNPVVEPTLHFSAQDEARGLLNRALSNWWALGKPYTPSMLKFSQNDENV
ncbi:hypothetical protein QFX18_11570 [Saccharophagus degradans]|uniref:hypothetical protein n=1 Tax=Saccharophagus degradans TaxID=86304 RepID=UPI00247823A9|nr:hypothetical protein [Saccharophagus degradans]WGO96685.1 hypothetical protein QFX18_11570 [Saccharophagus degradans]